MSVAAVGGAAASDDDLLEAARAGDRAAFGVLYARHRAAARWVAGRWVASACDADDVVADAFAGVFAALGRMQPGQMLFRRYLLCAVRNAARDRLRRADRWDLSPLPPEMASRDTADSTVLAGAERAQLADALAEMPPRYRTVLWLTEVEGRDHTEVARDLSTTPNGVAALAYRARNRLRRNYLAANLRDVPAA